MNAKSEIIEMPQRAPAALVSSNRMSAMEVVQHAAAVQEVMNAVMKPNVHFGKIPGTDKPTLYKSGAEVLCMSFRIADEYHVEDLSTADMIRYRVTCVGKHQVSDVVLGSGMGEASTGEEKYKWRSAVCLEEFEATPAAMRRVKFGKKKGGGFYKANQVRTEPSDLANTVLKMACKRAKMAMVLNVTAASDIFSQDLEDLDETLREHLTDPDGDVPEQPRRAAEPQRQPPSEELLKEARDAANQGVTAYQKFWASTTKENRQMLAGEHDTLKATASRIDAQKQAGDAPPSEREPGADDELEADFQKQLAREQGDQQ